MFRPEIIRDRADANAIRRQPVPFRFSPGIEDKLQERLYAAIPTNHRGVKPLLQQTKPNLAK